MATPKPTIVLVPGAFHYPDAFQSLTSQLEAAGYTCVGVKLPSVNASPPHEGFEQDIDAIKAAIQPEIDADRDVLVLMHSYGSVPAGEAIKGLDKASRRKDGGRGGVSHLFYCAAFAPPKGSSLMDMLGGQPLPWFSISEDEKTVCASDPADIFYGDVAPELQAASVAAVKPHSYRTMFSKTTREPWRDVPCTYLYCTADKAIPIAVQRGMVEATGAKWGSETIEGASHSPFLSRTAETAEAVRRAAGESI